MRVISSGVASLSNAWVGKGSPPGRGGRRPRRRRNRGPRQRAEARDVAEAGPLVDGGDLLERQALGNRHRESRCAADQRRQDLGAGRRAGELVLAAADATIVAMPRTIRTVRSTDGIIAVLDGSTAGERVVTKGPLFIDQVAALRQTKVA